MQNILLTLTCCLVYLTSPGTAQVRMVPHLTHPDGGFQTRLLAVNTGTEDHTLVLIPFSEDGTQYIPLSETVPKGQTLWLSSQDWTVVGTEISHFRLDGSDHDIKVYAVYTYAFGEGSAAHVMETGRQGKIFRIYPGDWNTIFDGIAAVNLGSEATTISVRQVDARGLLIDSREMVTSLAPGAKTRFVIGGPNEPHFTPQTGCAFDIVATQEIALTALRGTPPQAPLGFLWAVEPTIFPEDLSVNQGFSPEQRVADFEQLVAMACKRYGPLLWKTRSIAVDIMGSAPAFRERVRLAKNDSEFFQIMFEFLSQFEDGHVSFWLPSNYVASLGFQVDLFDNRLLVYEVSDSSTTLEVGDEILSVDGESAENLIERLPVYTPCGFDRISRRWATALITNRPQSTHPQLVSGEAVVTIRRQQGNQETLSLPWTVSGTPFIPGQYEDVFTKKSAIPVPKTTMDQLQWIAPPTHRLELLMNTGKYGHVWPSYALPNDFFYRVGGVNEEIFSGTYLYFVTLDQRNRSKL